ncbi:amino acid adenylation domain-containing protein [Chitinophaga sp. RAB17]|uniref:amino acid adenylation domain-containing protein n=1 Tax=Chitinophaga sp. RAB17 TaxID=3233049 RepID=UPI003F9280B3
MEIIATLKQNKVVPRLDGDRLKLIGETRSLSEECLEQIRARKSELIAFLRSAGEQFDFVPIPPAPVQEYYPASNAQKRIWVLCQFEGATSAYNIIRSFYLKGTVNKDHLNKAFQLTIQRHESLRTVFIAADGIPQQQVLNHMPFNIAFEDISEEAHIKDRLKSEVETSAGWQLNLEKGPLLRVELFRLSNDEHAMIFCLHHIVSDGWSISVMVQEVMRFYEALCKNETPVIAPLEIQYKDYMHWLTQRIDSAKGEEARDFWRSQFAEEAPALHLPTDFPRPAMQSFDGAVAKFYFDDTLYQRIQTFCRGTQITPFNFFRATLTLLLSKFSGQKNITIGTPVSGRNHADLENQVGLYVNTLPLRMEINPEDPFTVFLKRTAEHSFRAFEFQDYPLDKIIEDLQLKRDTGRNPLFDVMMVLQNTAIGDGSINLSKQYGFELGLLDKYLPHTTSGTDPKMAVKFDLNFNFDNEPGNKFFLEIEYATRLFKKERIIHFFEAYIHIITQVLANPEMPLSNIEIISSKEKQRILTIFNAPVEDIIEHNIMALLQASFEKQESKPAIITAEVTLSYQQLAGSAANVSAYLSEITGTSRHPFVGLLMDRSEWMIISILGILQSGAAYVPVDTQYPVTRINYIIEDAHPELLIVDDAGLLKVPGNYNGRVIHINELKARAFPATNNPVLHKDLREQCAYLIYTSGSTGSPKGVEICHRNAIAFLKWAKTAFANTDFDILYATTSYCFDLSVFEFFVPLLLGKTIRLLPSAVEIPNVIAFDKKVMINTVPSVVRSLLDAGMDWSNVTALNMAGEPVPKKMKQDLDYTRMEVRNLYGPSEDTTYSTVYRFEDDEHLSIPIGNPVGYTQLYIMDEHRNLLPEGVEGEIYLSGQSVAKGYFNKPALTAAKFMENPFVPGMTMYRTGDVGRWLADGKVAFTGRIDDQVKIRGYRIEPGEIQYLLEQHPQVTQAVIIVKSIDATPQLLAYWVGTDAVNHALLKEYLLQALPAYMVPGYWLKLDAVPLNSNGKVDRQKLPHPVAAQIEEFHIIAPRTNTEQQLIALWETALQAKVSGVTHNFFDAGGHSLKATVLRSLVLKKLEKELTLNDIFTHPTIAQQARILEARPKVLATPILPVKEQDWYPISYAQERLWVLTNFEEASRTYNMPAAFRIHGTLQVEILEDAFRMVIQKHEILRTIFAEREGRPVQIVLSPEAVSFAIKTITITGALTPDEERKFLQQQWQMPFNLGKGPLLTCFILKTGNSQLLCFNMHHIISDGWSVVVLYNEVMDVYQALATGSKMKVLPPPALQYRDFAVWQREQLTGERIGEQLSFWKEIFSDTIPILELPTDFHRPDVKTYQGATARFQFNEAATKKIHQLTRQADVSLFIALMAGVTVLLKKYANQNDIVIGTPVAGRDHPQLQDQIGFYVNTLPVRTRINSKETFVDLLRQQQASILKAFEFQDVPFEMLVASLQLKKNLSRSPLFDVMVVLQNLEGLQADNMRYVLPTLELERLDMPAGVAKYDLTFSFAPETDSLLLELEYNTSLFTSETVAQICRHLNRIFEQVTISPEISIKDIVLTDEQEGSIWMDRADQTHVAYDTNATIVSLFQQAVRHFPDRIALVAGAQTFTYRELDIKSGQLARVLINDYNVMPEELVLLHFDRSEWMLIGILAVLKAGAAYVPVDPFYPAARIDYMMEDSKSRLLLFDIAPYNGIAEKWSHMVLLDITRHHYSGDTAVAVIQSHYLAYVIYTSGTTGNPKGVLIEHRNVTRLLFNEANRFDFNATDVWSLFHSYCFDFSVWEMYGALLYGGRLVMVPKVIAQDSMAFYDFLQKEGITVLNQTPTAFRSLVLHNRERFAATPLSVRYLIFGGEMLRPEILREWYQAFPGCRNINMYGITETTVHVTYKEMSAAAITANKSNIGLPIPTLSCYVLDMDLQPVLPGVTGELCVGGAGVARGYLNKPALTAEKFVDHPFRKGEKIYRSGDYARILPSGEIEYIGRRDEQVKIRGHRIETGEIEMGIMQLDGIKDAVVLPIKGAHDEYDLVAYFITEEEDAQSDIRKRLNAILPAYMVPAHLIPLPAFPLNSNGKLDKTALPQPQVLSGKLSGYMPARNDIDQQVIAIWETILDKDNIGIKDNFFDLGGHSLKATRVISRIHELFGVKIDLQHLFVDPTVEHLANYIETIRWMDSKNEVPVEGEDELIF